MKESTIKLLNTIRSIASNDYQERIPQATKDNYQEIGRSLTSYTPVLNEFTGLLVKIGLQVFSTKTANNKLARFKKGLLGEGTDIEEIFVSMAKGVEFDKDGKNPMGRRTPDIKHLYHRENYKNMYEVSVSDAQVKNAFLSQNGVQNLLAQIVNSMYSGANYDEYLNMKELTGSYDGYAAYEVPNPVDETTTKQFMKQVRKAVNDLSFTSDKYNKSKVLTHTEKSDMIMLVHKDVLSEVDIELLAKTFNMGKTDFETEIIVVDDFGSALTDTHAILVDKSFYMVYDTLQTVESIRNPQGLFTNYFLHVWQLHSISTFANAIAFKTTKTA